MKDRVNVLAGCHSSSSPQKGGPLDGDGKYLRGLALPIWPYWSEWATMHTQQMAGDRDDGK